MSFHRLSPRRSWCPRDGRFAGLALAFIASFAASAAPAAIIQDHLYAVDAADARQAWVVGAFGTIYRTRDGGQSWEPQASGTKEHLFDVDFHDANTGWIVGRSGTVLKTTDGGATWVRQSTGNARHLFDVAVIDAQHAVAIGDWGTILVTADGEKWDDRTFSRDVILNSQSWPDLQHGWIVGEAGVILSSTDGGQTWNELETGIYKTLYGVDFESPQEGLVVGLDGLILSTADGGATWKTLRGDPELSALDQVGSRAGIENPHLYDVQRVGTLALAAGDNSSVFMSEDGGATWKAAAVPASADLRWLRGLALANAGSAYVVGASGLVLGLSGSGLSLLSGSEE